MAEEKITDEIISKGNIVLPSVKDQIVAPAQTSLESLTLGDKNDKNDKKQEVEETKEQTEVAIAEENKQES